jgi:hypothetical protein
MPLQNRVTPGGELFAAPARGTFMGNRGGVIHNGNREIVRQYASRRWITCVLEFKGRRRVVMTPNRYTELFFLDEAVALAAGHRPCAECRRERFNAFKQAWTRSQDVPEGGYLYANTIDLELHRTRIGHRKGKITYDAPLNSLPDGCYVRIAESSYLVWGDALFKWSPTGYVERLHRSSDASVEVLTPEPMVRCLRNGYLPQIHSSLPGLSDAGTASHGVAPKISMIS